MSFIAWSARSWLGYRTTFESWLSLSADQSLGRWFSSLIWMAGATFAMFLARPENGSKEGPRFATRRWIAFALLCAALSVEESTQLLPRLVDPLHSQWPSIDYSPLMAFLAALVILLGFRRLIMIDVSRSSARLLLVAGALYLVGRVSSSFLLAAPSGWLGSRANLFVVTETVGRVLAMTSPVLVLRALGGELGRRGRGIAIVPKMTP